MIDTKQLKEYGEKYLMQRIEQLTGYTPYDIQFEVNDDALREVIYISFQYRWMGVQYGQTLAITATQIMAVSRTQLIDFLREVLDKLAHQVASVMATQNPPPASKATASGGQ